MQPVGVLLFHFTDTLLSLSLCLTLPLYFSSLLFPAHSRCVSICIPVCLCIHLPFFIFLCLSVCLSVCLWNEQQHGRSLRHPFLIRCYGAFQCNGSLVLVMDLLTRDLVSALNSRKNLDIFRIIYQLASGLDYLHQRNWVHRDVKPRNILVRPVCVQSLTQHIAPSLSLLVLSLSRSSVCIRVWYS